MTLIARGGRNHPQIKCVVKELSLDNVLYVLVIHDATLHLLSKPSCPCLTKL